MTGHCEFETRKRAFEIWEREGRSGDPVAHWFQAERELAQHSASREDSACAENLPEGWAAAIEGAIDKLVRRARPRPSSGIGRR
jgi:hypothetical protein